ncbi:MAG: ABC transporter permease [Eubacteriaceae bacterium]
MFDKDIIKLAWMSLWRRKLRTILTMIGIMIGTAGIVTMISLGAGLQRSITSEFEGSNMTNIEVTPNYEIVEESSTSVSVREIQVLKKEDVLELKKLEGVKAVTPIYQMYGEIYINRESVGVNFIGVDIHEAQDLGYELEEGRYPRGSEILIGSTLLEEIQTSTGKDAIVRKAATINMFGVDSAEERYEYRTKIVGAIKESGGSEDYSAIMDIDQLIKITEESQKNPDLFDEQGYSSIRVVAEDTEIVESLSEEINEMGYMALSTKDILESIGSVFKFVQIFLGGIGSIALIVAAIGITNTMIMSIYERTKEIGVNKVIGASVKDIRTQFLYEASFIGLMGGVAGLILSYSLTFIINFIGSAIINSQAGTSEAITITYIPPWLALFAISFSVVVGILAGLYPANRAAKISVLEALRQE